MPTHSISSDPNKRTPANKCISTVQVGRLDSAYKNVWEIELFTSVFLSKRK